jgi:hypothetical protein
VSSGSSRFHLLFLADTHLGFDQAVRPRVKRRRRGPDFLANFRRVLAAAVEQQVDLVLHGGDLFFRSRVPEAIVDQVYGELTSFADHGIPLVIVPGNHERSRLPTSLFLEHPNIHIFGAPTTFRFDLGGAHVALAGFPNARSNARGDFRRLVAATGWDDAPADIRLFCLHQIIEGATVGPSGYTFRNGHDVIRQRDLPAAFHAVLAGHVHRHQVLQVQRNGAHPLPVIYPGSTERTSFAEAEETKGYCRLGFRPSPAGDWVLSRSEFVHLPTRPMVTVNVPDELEAADVAGFLSGVAREAPPDAIVRFTCSDAVPPATRRAFESGRLADCLPSTMNIQFAGGFFDRRDSEAPVVRESDRRQLALEIIETVPRAPGVYALLDGDGQLLYIGKSVNLRQRMAGYFLQDPLSAEPHLGRLSASIRSFAWWQTRSELLALLLEDVLIKEHLPPMNTRQREFAENRYLELTDDEFPACLVVEHVEDFRARDVFGPMRDKYHAAAMQDILHVILGIRTCSEPEPVRRCLEHDIGRCAGPCRGALEPGEYQERVAMAGGFLRGDPEAVLDRLLRARDRAAAAKRYEEAARLQDAIGTCRRFAAQQRFATRFARDECMVSSAGDGIEYRFAAGALVAPRVIVAAHGRSKRHRASKRDSFRPEPAGRRAVAILHRSPSADRRFLADRTRIVWSWARRHADDCEVRFGGVRDRVPENGPSRLV